MTSCLIGPRALAVSLSDRLVVYRAHEIGCAPGSRRRDRGAAGVGQEALSQILFAVPRRRGTAKATPPASAPGPATSRRASSRFGRLPTERSRPIQDLVNIIRRGMPYTSMPAWPTCPTRKCRISPTSSRPSPPTSRTRERPQPVRSRARRDHEESIELGKKLAETGCVKCHGNLGRGDGPSAPTLKDDWGIRYARRTSRRAGPSGEDRPRGYLPDDEHGLNGTPMPSFADSLTTEQRWAITDFIVSLSGSNGLAIPTSSSPSRPGSDRSGQGAASFESAPVARFPIVGQIMEPGRAFHPPATS